METTSANRPSRQRPRPIAGRTGGTAEPATLSPGRPVEHGFLSHRFMPMYQPAEDLPDREQAEKGVLQSLSFLQQHYGIQAAEHRSLPYPYNVLMSVWDTENKLKNFSRHREILIGKADNEQVSFTIKETFRRDFGLYYIPVKPLFDLWHLEAYQHCGEILTAVAAYLYIEAGLTYYRDEDTYMYYNYEILEDWIEDDREDDDEEAYLLRKSGIENAKNWGDFIQEKMMAKGFRHSLDSLIAAFNPTSDFERECLIVAQNAWDLWQAFPNRHLYQNANLTDADYDDDYDYDNNSFVALHEYIGFICSDDGALSDDILQMVNNDFNERPRFQEPEIKTCFDEAKPAYTDGLAFEERLLILIDDLCTLLYNRP